MSGNFFITTQQNCKIMKPEYQIEEWAIVDSAWRIKQATDNGRLFLIGKIQDHPNCTNGRVQKTSPIVRMLEPNVIETKNSIYKLGKPYILN
jgi:hypothetical protein